MTKTPNAHSVNSLVAVGLFNMLRRLAGAKTLNLEIMQVEGGCSTQEE